ncbi:DUF4199 domain-containing protein [Bacteroidales bacterium OttesenSCG-928-K03]|nr:DUF4199 domain-containing protein [Odoribacter sp. OttesenSCG-928-L07]MDL2242692.1 DUF4199 domain-containing protein [Bacteroidales bacterium OttesenSCG-928-K03]
MNVWKNRLLYGGIAGAVLLAYNVALQIMGVQFGSGTMGFLNVILVTSIYVFAMVKGIKRYSNDHLEGYISYNQGFKHGFFIYLIAAFINGLRDWVNVSFLNGKQVMLDAYDEVLEGFYDTVGSETYDMVMNMLETMLSPVPYLIIIIVNVALTALIVALIVAVFTKKEKPF